MQLEIQCQPRIKASLLTDPIHIIARRQYVIFTQLHSESPELYSAYDGKNTPSQPSTHIPFSFPQKC